VGLQVPPAAFDLDQLLVSQGDVLGAHRRVRAAQQVLAVQLRLGGDLGVVHPEQPARRLAQVAVRASHHRDFPGQLGPPACGQGVGAGDQRLQLADHHLAQRGVAVGGLGVEADDEPLVVGDLDLFDLQVVGHQLVAAGPGRARAKSLDRLLTCADAAVQGLRSGAETGPSRRQTDRQVALTCAGVECSPCKWRA
jgi:hypothetical protein